MRLCLYRLMPCLIIICYKLTTKGYSYFYRYYKYPKNTTHNIWNAACE